MRKDKQYSDSLRIGVLLALTGGFLDAYTYLCRGKVFANAQTGNMVMLGISCMESDIKNAVRYLIPILSFAVGVLITEIIRSRNNNNIHWRQIILALEIILIILVGFLPVGRFDYLANIIISLVCSLQVQTFRKFHGNVYATTMCTGNLRSGTEKLVLFIKSKDKNHLKISLQYYLIIMIFCIGAFIGGKITLIIGVKSVVFAVIPLIISFFLMNKSFISIGKDYDENDREIVI